MIPQLVRLMTKLDHNDAELASGAEGARQRGTALERRKLAEDNRKLAESAGQMLYTLIIEGTPEVRAATMAVEQRACCAECAMLAPIAFPRHFGGISLTRIAALLQVRGRIIAAIIAMVQQPGSTPPEDVPDLMTILRSGAHTEGRSN